MRRFSSKRRVLAALVILLALFLIRPGASHLKSRIISSISAGVGRPVDIGAVHIRLLPRPGFDLRNFVVYDDPAFGAEPILRAGDVTAALRLMSLVRGRLEISRLDLTEPSLNLVLRQDGRWNLDALVEHTLHIPLAPTAKPKREPRPGFPYIEGSSGRINFKAGPEKKPYALTNADFSLWQESENTWGVRLKAQPFRSDMNLNDTGQLQLNGTWQRAVALRETPLDFRIEWSRAQLGQLTKFFTGNDQGWRGAVQLEVALSGTPAKLLIASDVSLEDFRRYDIMSGQSLRMAGHCDAEYSSVVREFCQVACKAPVGNGLITVTGDGGLPGSHHYSILVSAERIPVSGAVLLAQRAKKNLPDDLTAQGTIQGNLSLREDAGAGMKPEFSGQGEIGDLTLGSAVNKAEFGPQSIPFSAVSESAETPWRTKASRGSSTTHLPEGPHIELGPVALAADHGSVLMLRGWINRNGYSFAVTGETEIARLLRLARTVGVPAPPATVGGKAQVDLQTAGVWTGRNDGTAASFAAPQVTGTAKLHEVRIAIRGAAAPVVIASAEMQLAPGRARVSNLKASAAESTWTGWLETPRGCKAADECPVRFSLNANQIVFSQLREWITPTPRKRAWYQVLESRPQSASLFTTILASGRLSADRFQMRGINATHVSGDLSLEAGNLRISELAGDLLGGKYRGEWRTDRSKAATLCGSSGVLSSVSLSGLDETMQDSWITGTANLSYAIRGPCTADFWQSAEGTFRLDMRDGTFSHLIIAEGADPLHVTRLTAEAKLRAGKFETSDARLVAPKGSYLLSGSASLERDIDFKLKRTQNGVVAASYAITGTLNDPRVTALPGAEQARLKTTLHSGSDK